MTATCQTDEPAPDSPILGVHLSLGRNPHLSLGDARLHGARAVQIFASSPGAWKPPVLRELQAPDLIAAREEQGITPLVIHAIYLINLASPNPTLVSRSIGSLIATLRTGSALRAAGVVTHIGSHGGRGYEDVAGQIAGALNRIVDETPADIDLFLENSAGAGGIIGSRLAELEDLLDRTGRPERLKIALDTAHLCGAGWNFASEGEARRLAAEIENGIGFDRLALIHANDSKVPCGSRKDRHANIGEGHIGLDGFRSLLAEHRLRQVPWILETPDLDSRLEPRERFGSLAHLRELARTVPNPPQLLGAGAPARVEGVDVPPSPGKEARW